MSAHWLKNWPKTKHLLVVTTKSIRTAREPRTLMAVEKEFQQILKYLPYESGRPTPLISDQTTENIDKNMYARSTVGICGIFVLM